MYVCYVDESGCMGALPSAVSPVQPVFVLAGVILGQAHLHDFTVDLLHLKRRFFPRKLPISADFLDWVLVEIKGAEIRGQLRRHGRDRRRHAIVFMESLLRLLETHSARIVGKLFVKGIGGRFDGRAVYTTSVQVICSSFQQYLATAADTGVVILDSRAKHTNVNVSHSIFTQKFQARGDRYARIPEMPAFGHSENHAGIQAADLLCSAFLFPMATSAYCLGLVNNVHVSPTYQCVGAMFGQRLRALQFRYEEAPGKWRGGITVSDGISQRNGGLLFQ